MTLTKNPIVHCIVLTKLIVCKLIRYCVPSAINGLKSFFLHKKIGAKHGIFKGNGWKGLSHHQDPEGKYSIVDGEG